MLRNGVFRGNRLVFLLKIVDLVCQLVQLADKFIRFLLKGLDTFGMAFPVVFCCFLDGFGLLAASGNFFLYAFDEYTRIHLFLRIEEERKQRKKNKIFVAHWPSPSIVVTGSGRSAGGRLPELISMAWAMAGK